MRAIGLGDGEDVWEADAEENGGADDQGETCSRGKPPGGTGRISQAQCPAKCDPQKMIEAFEQEQKGAGEIDCEQDLGKNHFSLHLNGIEGADGDAHDGAAKTGDPEALQGLATASVDKQKDAAREHGCGKDAIGCNHEGVKKSDHRSSIPLLRPGEGLTIRI